MSHFFFENGKILNGMVSKSFSDETTLLPYLTMQLFSPILVLLILQSAAPYGLNPTLRTNSLTRHMWQSTSERTTSNFPRKTALNVATPVVAPVPSLSSPDKSSPVPVTPSPPSKRLGEKKKKIIQHACSSLALLQKNFNSHPRPTSSHFPAPQSSVYPI